MEARAGGRFYERFKDGEEFVVGHVTVCDRPSRIAFTWGPVGEPETEVDARFTADGDGTRVDLEHRCVEKMAAGSHTFERGWDDVLSYFVRAA